MNYIGSLISTFFIAMAPVVELRGAIPAGVAAGLPVWASALAAMAGNMIPVPLILVFIREILKWMEKKSAFLAGLARKLQDKAEKNKAKVLEYEFWGLVALVAVPLPGTGAWTGAMVAATLDMQLKRAVPAILLGVLIAGILVSLATAGVVAAI